MQPMKVKRTSSPVSLYTFCKQSLLIFMSSWLSEVTGQLSTCDKFKSRDPILTNGKPSRPSRDPRIVGHLPQCIARVKHSNRNKTQNPDGRRTNTSTKMRSLEMTSFSVHDTIALQNMCFHVPKRFVLFCFVVLFHVCARVCEYFGAVHAF